MDRHGPISPLGNETADELAPTQNAALFRFIFSGVLRLSQVSELRTRIGGYFSLKGNQSVRSVVWRGLY